MKKTLEQLKQEAADAQAAVQAAEQADRVAKQKKIDEERAERTRQEQRAAIANQHDVFTKLLMALHEGGLTSACIDKDGRFHARGINNLRNVDVNIEKHHSSTYYGSDKHRGEKKIVVGDYGDRKSFFKTGSGDYNYGTIAAHIIKRVVAMQQEESRTMVQTKAKTTGVKIIERLKAEAGVESTTIMVASKWVTDHVNGGRKEITAPEGMIYMDIGCIAVTPEQAHFVLAALKTTGLVK